MLSNKKLLAVLLAGITLSPLAQATNGYFAHGYGMRSLGMAGVAYALPQDALVIASNPAGLSALGNRIDAGVTWFKPQRSSTITGNGAGLNGHYDANGTETFLIPEFGYSRQLDERFTVGLAAYGNGGMNTDYRQNPFNALSRTGPLGSAGVDLEQAFVSPAVAWKVNEQHSIGLAAIYAHQRFAARGLQPFTAFSAEPTRVTNNGHDHSSGWGVRLGWTGQLTDTLTLGAAWASKISMSRFSQYEGLFADGGSFDIPENFGAGLAWKATDRLTFAADVQQINYSDVQSIANSIDQLFAAGQVLGSANGPGFGWEDIRVYKLGASYALDTRWTVRAGFSWADQALDRHETFFNTLAPGVIRKHLTLGATFAVAENQELSAFYARAFAEELNGNQSINASLGGGEANLKMRQDSVGVGYTWKL